MLNKRRRNITPLHIFAVLGVLVSSLFWAYCNKQTSVKIHNREQLLTKWKLDEFVDIGSDYAFLDFINNVNVDFQTSITNEMDRSLLTTIADMLIRIEAGDWAAYKDFHFERGGVLPEVDQVKTGLRAFLREAKSIQTDSATAEALLKQIWASSYGDSHGPWQKIATTNASVQIIESNGAMDYKAYTDKVLKTEENVGVSKISTLFQFEKPSTPTKYALFTATIMDSAGEAAPYTLLYWWNESCSKWVFDAYLKRYSGAKTIAFL